MNVDKIGNSLGLTTEQVMKEFKDARVISRFSEYWAGRMYDYKKIDNSNNACYDGIIENKLLGSIRVSIKSLTYSGIRFQQSKYVGSGRICNKEKLLQSFDNVDFLIVVDIINFPLIRFIPIQIDVLINLTKKNLLTCSGYDKSRFYRNIFNKTSEEIKFDKFDIYSKGI